MREPGLDLHDWETRWQQLESELAGAPEETLPELADLVESMLDDRGFELDDEVTAHGDDREVQAAYRAARDVADRLERGDEVERGDVDSAAASLRMVYDHVTSNRPGE